MKLFRATQFHMFCLEIVSHFDMKANEIVSHFPLFNTLVNSLIKSLKNLNEIEIPEGKQVSRLESLKIYKFYFILIINLII